MTFLGAVVHYPQRMWLRRALFQIHLWVGLMLLFYLILISVTGAVLVFREDLEAIALQSSELGQAAEPATGTGASDVRTADVDSLLERIRTAYPGARITSLLAPARATPRTTPWMIATIQTLEPEIGVSRVAIHPETGAILGALSRRLPGRWSWLGTLRNLHATLLGGVTGRQINGALAGGLLLMCCSGILLWWPGIGTWTQALRFDASLSWRRINFDLHRATGFWTLAITSFWAVSGIFFGFSKEVTNLVERVSPITTARPPVVRFAPGQAVGDPPTIQSMLQDALRSEPGARWREIVLPSSRRSPLAIVLQRAGTQGVDFTDTLYFDPAIGRYLQTWRYGVNATLGDWFLWSQRPLHFGSFAGFPAKLVWALLSLAIPLLALTGALMYWNRFLGKRWARLR
jgi:uncharacterized iron-regulated membrane protein